MRKGAFTPPNPKHHGTSARDWAGFTLIELIFVVAIIIMFMSILTPFIYKIRVKAKIVGCEENLEKISLALNSYAEKNQGKFPETLAELAKGGYVKDGNVFNCPASHHTGTPEDPDYEYTKGCSVATSSDTKVVSDKAGNHKAGKHVLYASGDIIWETRIHTD